MGQYDHDGKRKVLPLLPLRGITVFPYMVVHFDVGREKSIAALEKAMVEDQYIFLVTQKDEKVDMPHQEDIYNVGTISKIKQLLKLPGDTIRVLVEGISRAEIKSITKDEPYFEADLAEREGVVDIEQDQQTLLEKEALMRSVMDIFEEYVKLNNRISSDIITSIISIDDPGQLADIIVASMFIKNQHKQQILEAFDPMKRLEILYEILQREIEILKIEDKINARVRSQIDKVQKEYYLKEQLKAIREELGDKDGIIEEAEEYKNNISKAGLPKEVKEKALKETERLIKMPDGSSEASVIRTYLDWILALPWNQETEDNLDLKNVEKTLNQDHYGLHKVKERIIEYLAVRQLTNTMKGPILCLVGPPGVGKTSIARSIARSLNRKFVHMSLGGVKDEAEIRGHRRTYIGAMPGRIIHSMRQAHAKNPVFLFDEIDKMTYDFRGDPASAMLEVLDPEQNNSFRDHYLDLPFDLSKVLFLTTANNVDTIPAPLRDRMEVIYINGYTDEEKVQIAKRYLIPKQIKEHGLKTKSIAMSDNTVKDIINLYTREAGVRNLEREIAKICRKSARRIVDEKVQSIRVNSRNLEKYLGIPRYRYGKVEEKDEIGVVTGLAWTPVGGDTLSIEVNVMKGSGKLELTGQLGDVMKESAKAALTYIRSKSEDLNIKDDFYKERDIHIHVPEGAIPKDGPSAGITMATAIVSALTDIPVKKDVAMTGEITLRGRILPIGGLKEKVLAAYRAGIKVIIIPEQNKRHLKDIDQNVKRNVNFITASSMDEVLEHALNRGVK
ncbi:MAG: endopeptidase La [Clostridia bacterium]|nr:endopeptidase La [Clostridia bacterium]